MLLVKNVLLKVLDHFFSLCVCVTYTLYRTCMHGSMHAYNKKTVSLIFSKMSFVGLYAKVMLINLIFLYLLYVKKKRKKRGIIIRLQVQKRGFDVDVLTCVRTRKKKKIFFL